MNPIERHCDKWHRTIGGQGRVNDGRRVETLRVTTDAYHGDGSLDTFREAFGREILGIEIDPLDGHSLHIDLTLRSLPGFAMASGTLSPMRNRHTPALLDNEDVVLVDMSYFNRTFRRRYGATPSQVRQEARRG